LCDAIHLAEVMLDQGLDGMPAVAIAPALGFSSIRSNAFSSLLSAARQFGLIELRHHSYRLTPLGRALPHPIDESHAARLRQEAFFLPRIYQDLARRLEDRPLPQVDVIANLLFQEHHITARAKRAAAETFLESAREAGLLSKDGVLRLQEYNQHSPVSGQLPPKSRPEPTEITNESMRIELPLRGRDQGKRIVASLPESITRESLDRFLAAIELHVLVTDDDHS
jgi:hypothetical protein